MATINLKQLNSGADLANAGLKTGLEAATSSADEKLRRFLQGQLIQTEKEKADRQKAQFDDLNAANPDRSVQVGEFRRGGVPVDPLAPLQRQAAQANITGFNVTDPRIIPTPKDAEEVKKAAGAMSRMSNVGQQVQQTIKDAGPLDRLGSFKVPFTDISVGTEKGKLLDSQLTDIKLQNKELNNLGAITGPDLELMNSSLGGVTGIGSLFNDKKGISDRLEQFLKRGQTGVVDQARSRGYTPIQPPAAPQDAEQAEYEALKAKYRPGSR